VKSVNSALTGCDIASEAQVGGGLQLLHPFGVVVGPHVVIGERCRILAGVVLGAGLRRASPTVGDDVLLGTHAVIIGGLTIGDGAEVGVHAFVTEDVPAHGSARSAKATIREPRRRA
jgi:serine acetyltransferase